MVLQTDEKNYQAVSYRMDAKDTLDEASSTKSPSSYFISRKKQTIEITASRT